MYIRTQKADCGYIHNLIGEYMNKSDFTECFKKYGISEDDVCRNRLKIGGEEVEEIAVISPINAAADYKNVGACVTQLSDGFFPTYRIEKDGVKFTFVAFQVGACNVCEVVCALAYSNCKKILFTGTVGAIKEEFSIGDIVLPRYSMCGDGATRYFTLGKVCDNNSTFGDKFYPDENLQSSLSAYLDGRDIKYSFANVFSIDTIVAQFFHIGEFLSRGADVLEMETAATFNAAKVFGLQACALFHVSDSTVEKKSLLGGRSKEEHELHRRTKLFTIPDLVCGFVKELKENK